MASAIGAAAVTAGGSVVSSLLGAKSAYDTNKANIASQENINERNIQFQTDTNLLNHQWSLENREAEQRFAIEQFERENAEWLSRTQNERDYNSPAAQTMRLKQAGINPALVGLDGNGASSVGSVGSAAVPSQSPAVAESPQLGVPTEQFVDYSGVTNAIASSVSNFFQNKLLSQQVRKNDIDLKYQDESITANLEYMRKQIDKLKADRSKTEAETRQLDTLQYMLDANTQDMILERHFNAKNAEITGRMLEESIKKMQVDEASTQLMGSLAVQRLNLDAQQIRAAVSETFAHIDLLRSQKKMTDAEVNESTARFLKTLSEKNGIDLSNKQAAAIAYDVRKQYEYQTERLRLENRQADLDYYNPFKYAGVNPSVGFLKSVK